jgi:predicted DNA binding protein
LKNTENDWQKYSNKKFNFSMSTPPEWTNMVKESPSSETVVLYNADKNLVRLIVSKNDDNKQFIGSLITSPFKTTILTDSGLRGKISIGTNKNDKKRIIAWFYAESGGITYHMVADMDTSFAIQNKDVLISIAKTFNLEQIT